MFKESSELNWLVSLSILQNLRYARSTKHSSSRKNLPHPDSHISYTIRMPQ